MSVLQADRVTANSQQYKFKRLDDEEIAFDVFVQEAWHVIEPSTSFVRGRHIDAICEHLTAVRHGQITRLLINMPPRHAKSTLISVLYPMWVWITSPSTRWLCASYVLSLAIRDNRKCRLLLQSPWWQERYGHLFQLSGDQNVKGRFENTMCGYRLATSVDGASTGEGGDILIIDDPHAAAESTSDTERESALRWFDETWSSRLNDQQAGAMIVVGQRIHEQDLSGHILELGGWEHLNLPAEFEPTNKGRTSIGWQDWRTNEHDLLWEERFSHEILARLKKSLGSTAYAAQFQQRPVPAGGGQFKQKWFRYFTLCDGYYQLEAPEGPKRILTENCWLFITEDLAISQKQTADYTVICVWAVTPDKDLLLLTRLRERLDNPEQQQQTVLLYQQYHPGFIKVESVAYQLALVQQLRKRGLPVREYKPVREKVSRASTAAVYYESGKVYHPKSAVWLQEWEDEFLLFPLGANDDQVDNATMACDEIAGATQSASDHLRALEDRLKKTQEGRKPHE